MCEGSLGHRTIRASCSVWSFPIPTSLNGPSMATPETGSEHHVAVVWRVFSWHLAHGPKSVVATGDSQGFRPAFVISFGTFWLLTFDFVPPPLPTCAAKQQTGKEEKTLSVGFPVTLPSVCLQVAVPRHGPACRCFSGCMCSGANRDKDWKLSANLKQTRRPPSFHPSIDTPPRSQSHPIAHRSSHRPSHPRPPPPPCPTPRASTTSRTASTPGR